MPSLPGVCALEGVLRPFPRFAASSLDRITGFTGFIRRGHGHLAACGLSYAMLSHVVRCSFLVWSLKAWHERGLLSSVWRKPQTHCSTETKAAIAIAAFQLRRLGWLAEPTANLADCAIRRCTTCHRADEIFAIIPAIRTAACVRWKVLPCCCRDTVEKVQKKEFL